METTWEATNLPRAKTLKNTSEESEKTLQMQKTWEAIIVPRSKKLKNEKHIML